MSKEIPSHVQPSLDALKNELNETNSWIVKGEELVKDLYQQQHDLNRRIEAQKLYVNQYKVIAEQKAKAIQVLENNHNL
jgi:hypothetical protein